MANNGIDLNLAGQALFIIICTCINVLTLHSRENKIKPVQSLLVTVHIIFKIFFLRLYNELE